MSAMSNYLENKLTDHIWRGIAYTMPTVLAVELYTAAPSDSGGGTPVSGGSYARGVLNPSVSNWESTNAGVSGASSGTGGATRNKVAITFPSPTGTWGTVTHFAVFDAATSGNMLFWGALTTPKLISSGDSAPSFAIDALTATLA